MVGTPLVDGASVTGTVLRAERGPKIIIFKFKQKVKYRRRTGHRQDMVRVRIDEISANGKRSKIESAPKAAPKRAAKATAAAAPEAVAPKAAASRAPRATGAAAKATSPAEEKPKRVTRGRTSAAAKDAGATEAKPKRATRSRAAKPDAGKE
jgi:large subunit ribosomal protein L21